MPATIGRARWGREQGLDQRPELIRHEVISKGCHGPRSCQTNPKGAKRRLSLADAVAPPREVNPRGYVVKRSPN